MVFLDTVNAVKMKVWRCCGIVSEERLPNREMKGERRNAEVEGLRQLSHDFSTKTQPVGGECLSNEVNRSLDKTELI